MSSDGNRTIRYTEDKPRNCRYCYFYVNRNVGCKLGGLENCHYRLPDKVTPKPSGKCSGCPYGKFAPCIGYCLKDLQSHNKGTGRD